MEMCEVCDMAKPDIWMPLYIGDYLADTMELTTEQHGAYLLLLMAYWKNGGPLSSNPTRLAAIARMPLDAWSNAQAMLSTFFDTESDPSLWISVRAEEEIAKAGSNADAKRVRAEKAAAARWGKNASSNAKADAQALHEDMLEECPSPSPSDKDQKHLPPTPKSKKPKTEFDPEWFATFWKLYPNKTAKPKALESFKRKCATPEDFERIMAGLKAHVLSELFVKDGGRFQPHPTTWLNQERYNDEVKPYVQGFESNSGGSRKGGASLVDRVRAANAHLLDDEPPAWEPEPGAFDAEFERIDEANGSLVGSDD